MSLLIPHYRIKRIIVDQSDFAAGAQTIQDVIDCADEELNFDACGITAVETADGEVYLLSLAMTPLDDIDSEEADYVASLVENGDF